MAGCWFKLKEVSEGEGGDPGAPEENSYRRRTRRSTNEAVRATRLSEYEMAVPGRRGPVLSTALGPGVNQDRRT